MKIILRNAKTIVEMRYIASLHLDSYRDSATPMVSVWMRSYTTSSCFNNM